MERRVPGAVRRDGKDAGLREGRELVGGEIDGAIHEAAWRRRWRVDPAQSVSRLARDSSARLAGRDVQGEPSARVPPLDRRIPPSCPGTSFTSTSRLSMPGIDIDLCERLRGPLSLHHERKLFEKNNTSYFLLHKQRQQMRLDNKTRSIIKSEVASRFGVDTVVRLFGSRVDDTQRGGDIDLFVEPIQTLENRIQEECRLSASLYIKLGGRKVDVLIRYAQEQLLPIHEEALRTGIIL